MKKIAALVLGASLCAGELAWAEPASSSRRADSRRVRPTQRIAPTHRMARRPRAAGPSQRNPANRYITQDYQPELQTNVKPKYRFGGMKVEIAGGLNAGYAYSTPPKQGATRNAVAVSIMFEQRLNDTFSLCPEFSYAQRGVQTNLVNLSGVTVVGDVRLDYLELPLLLKMRLLMPSPRWKLFFVAGPSVSVAMNRQVNVLGLVDVDLGNRFATADANIILGGGVEYRVSPELTMGVHLRHHMGLVDIDTTTNNFYTRDIQLLLGAQFRL